MTRHIVCFGLQLTIVLNMSATVRAAFLYWDGTGTAWGAASDWSTSPIASTPDPTSPPGASDIAFFNSAGVAGPQTVNLNANQSVASLLVQSAGNLLIQSGSGTNTLSIGTGGIGSAGSVGPVTISSAVSLTGPQSWENDSNNSLTVSGNVSNGENLLTIPGTSDVAISGAISGGGGLIKNGTGFLGLTGATDNSGLGLTVNGGLVVLAKTSTAAVHAIGASGLTIGAVGGNTGEVQLGNNTGDQILNTAPVTVNSGGAFDVNGKDETVGTLSLQGVGTIAEGALVNGAVGDDATITASNIVLTDFAAIGVSSSSSHLTLNGPLTTSNRLLKVGDGTLILGGIGAKTLGNLLTVLDGTLTLASGAADLNANGGISISATSPGADTGIVIQSGTHMSVNSTLKVGNTNPLNASFLTVTGAGSSVTLGTGAVLDVGNDFSVNPVSVHVDNGGSLTLGTNGTTIMRTNATLFINGGAVDLKNVTVSGGTVNLTMGSLSFLGNLTVGTGGLLGPNVTLAANQSVTLSGVTTIDSLHSLTLSGGTLATSAIVVNGLFNNSGGTLSIAPGGTVSVGAGGDLKTSSSIVVPIVGTANNATIDVQSSGISLGDATNFAGFNLQGKLNVGANIVTLNSAGYAQLGTVTTLVGGTINAPNGVAFGSGSNFAGHGSIVGRVTGQLGSVISADGSLALGDINSPAGFDFGGELRVGSNTVNLNSNASATVGNLTTLGSGASAGTLNVTNDLVVDFGSAVTGFGTINSSNVLAKHSTISGTVRGASMSQPITLSGYIKGTGTFTNVTFTGTHDPGLSPTLLSVGSIGYAPGSTLIMEIGGTIRSLPTQYDAIVASGNLSLGGKLVVSLINNFVPGTGNSFDILDWSTLTGTFSSLQLPALVGGLTWNTSQLYVTGTLSVAGVRGDYNHNGIVDAADYTIWRDSLGSATNLAADGNGNGVIDANDISVWQMHFGEHAGTGADAAVPAPEPATMLMLLIGIVTFWGRRRFQVPLTHLRVRCANHRPS
jgi:hypothetical protein